MQYTGHEYKENRRRESLLADEDVWLEKMRALQEKVDLEGWDASQISSTQILHPSHSRRRCIAALRYSQRTTLPTHLGMIAFKGLSLEWLRDRRNWSLAQVTQFMKEQGALNPADTNRALCTPTEVLRQFLWGAPKLRELLDLLDEISRDSRLPAHKRKVMVMCQAPKTAEVIYTLLRYLGISTALLASDTRARNRETIIERFNETAHIDVLITCFSLDIAGHDCHRRCARAIIVEPAFNWATEAQFAHRTHRIGQDCDVEITRLFSPDTC